MMASHQEIAFEDEICAHLSANGWLYSDNTHGYDKGRALYPADLFAWLEETQADELAKVVTPGAPTETAQREQLLDRIVKVLDTPMEHGGGTLNALRKPIGHVSARFSLCEFQPETTRNQSTLDRFEKNRVRVMRQVHYSTAHSNSIDLVLFVNGLPVATIELKTDFTQSVEHAKRQYKKDRLPRDPKTGHVEPLLGFGTRALVHFAVSNDEVWMTTRLAGNDTHFLPFNMGDGESGTNPPNPSGSRTAYLWERVLECSAWLDILGKFMHVEVRTDIDPITGKAKKSTTLLFPRFHQWDAVTKLTTVARNEGPGHRYLVQHSAGSGKTNSIAWLAHRLARLHDASNHKVFDSVIVVTDRTVLDSQLQDAIRQIDSQQGVVATITGDEAQKAGETSKSQLLAKSLTGGKLIVVVTLQTFPYALQAIRETKGLAHKRFAVIADEAHSSQTGETANKLKSVLSTEELADLADGGEIDVEAVLAAEQTGRVGQDKISYFAFTATPKGKTLELFGRPSAGGKPVPFHVYSMQQAIEEGFILDVLRGYHEYDTAFRIAQTAADGRLKAAGPGQEPQPDEDVLVDQNAATKALLRWVKLHPTNISQKVAIIVEHFRQNVEGLLDGHAKAMIVCDSRKAAVRYKLGIDKYIAEQGYTTLRTLVAFSGSVEDLESGPDPFTEASMNPDAGGQDLRRAFAKPDFNIMLVANKFQTGFDQPLLCAMYVDKRLSGVTAVQTLSRLNRTLPSRGKDRTFILDFVNSAEEIQAAFEPYYKAAYLERETDPNLVHDLRTKLDAAGIYTWPEVEATVEAWVRYAGNNALAKSVDPGKERFRSAYLAAVQKDDKAELDRLDLFRKDVGTYVRLYDFMSQIVDYGETDLMRLAVYLRLLERLIRPGDYVADIDLSDVELTHTQQIDRGVKDVRLQGDKGLTGVTAAGSGTKPDPKMVLLEEAIARLNELFGDESFTEGQKERWVRNVVDSLMENDTLVEQASVNVESQFLESPDLSDAVTIAVLGNQDSQNRMADAFTQGGHVQSVLVDILGRLVHLEAQERRAA